MSDKKMFIELPSELEVKREIKSIVDKGLGEEKRGLKKPFLMTAATLIVSLFLLGFAFPTYASQIPIIGGIFEMFDSENHHRDYSSMQEFATETGLTGEINGLIVTIEETFFNGQTLYFTYRIESDRVLNEGYPSFQISEPEIWVDGVNIAEYSGFFSTPGLVQRISENNYVAVGSVGFMHLGENVESGEVRFMLDNWHVILPVERVAGNIVYINESVGNEGFEATITQMVVSPVNVLIYFAYIQPAEYDILGWDFFVRSPVPEGVEARFNMRVIDDLGNEYDWQMSSGGIVDDGVGGWLEIIEPLHPEASELIVTPYFDIHHWYLGDWRHTGNGSVGSNEVIANGGSWDQREVILGEIIIPLP